MQLRLNKVILEPFVLRIFRGGPWIPLNLACLKLYSVNAVPACFHEHLDHTRHTRTEYHGQIGPDSGTGVSSNSIWASSAVEELKEQYKSYAETLPLG